MGLGGRSVALRGPLQADSKKSIKKLLLNVSCSIIAGEKYIGMEDAARVVFFNASRH